MRAAAALLALPALLVAAPAGGQGAAGPSAQQGGFGAMLVMTADPAALRRAWASPQPRVNATAKASRGKPVFAMVIFSGCRAAADGKCRVTGRFSVTRPDGRPYQAPTTVKLWSGAPAAPRKMLLAQGSVGLKLEPKDPLGPYRVRALVTDHVAGITLPVEQAVTAQ